MPFNIKKKEFEQIKKFIKTRLVPPTGINNYFKSIV